MWWTGLRTDPDPQGERKPGPVSAHLAVLLIALRAGVPLEFVDQCERAQADTRGTEEVAVRGVRVRDIGRVDQAEHAQQRTVHVSDFPAARGRQDGQQVRELRTFGTRERAVRLGVHLRGWVD